MDPGSYALPYSVFASAVREQIIDFVEYTEVDFKVHMKESFISSAKNYVTCRLNFKFEIGLLLSFYRRSKTLKVSTSKSWTSSLEPKF